MTEDFVYWVGNGQGDGAVLSDEEVDKLGLSKNGPDG